MENYLTKFNGKSEAEMHQMLNGKSVNDYIIDNIINPLQGFSIADVEYFFAEALKKAKTSPFYFLDSISNK